MKKPLPILLLLIFLASFTKIQKPNMSNIWNRFEIWLTKNAPHLNNDLNKGATDKNILQLEELLEVKLPKSYVDFLKIHNGQNRNSEGLIDTEELLSTERIADEWKVWKEIFDKGEFKDFKSIPDKGIKNDWWNPKWIPISFDGSGNHYCIDLDPKSEGTKGQIIRMWHDSDERELLAPSFKVWITLYINDLENGKYVYSKDWGGIINKNDL